MMRAAKSYMLSEDIELCLSQAFMHARAVREGCMNIEHLLLAILDNPFTQAALEFYLIDVPAIKKEISRFIHRTTHFTNASKPNATDLHFSLGFQRVIQRAAFLAQRTGFEKINGVHLLLSILAEPHAQATYFLKKYGVYRAPLFNYLIRKLYKLPPKGVSPSPGREPEAAESTFNLETCLENLTLLAKQGKLAPLIGREKELQRTIEILCRHKKNNPLLLGDAGVGKSTLAEGLAQALANNQVPKALRGASLLSLDLASLLAGTKYRGDFEKRIKALLIYLQQKQKTILFIDEIHTIVGAGSSSGGHLDIANLLKPVLSSGKIKVFGATTFQEYHDILESDRALNRRFQPVRLTEPSEEETFSILKGIKHHYEVHHGVQYSAEVLRETVKLADEHLPNRCFPDKAIDLMDELGASFQEEAIEGKLKKLNIKDLRPTLAKLSNKPNLGVESALKQLESIRAKLEQKLCGQSVAVQSLMDALTLLYTELGYAKSSTLGNFLFLGPRNIGKQTAARTLAHAIGSGFLYFEMSSFNEKHTISTFMGSPAGYAGYEKGGALTRAIQQNPYTLVFLDGIDKAHPEIIHWLAQGLENGALQDAQGKKVSFKQTLFVLSCSVHESAQKVQPVGFHGINPLDYRQHLSQLRRTLPQALLAQINETVQFYPFCDQTIHTFLNFQLEALRAQLKAKDLYLQVSDKILTFLQAKLISPGQPINAQTLLNLFDRSVRLPIAKKLLTLKKLRDLTCVVSSPLNVQDDEVICEFVKRTSEGNPKACKVRPQKSHSEQSVHLSPIPSSA